MQKTGKILWQDLTVENAGEIKDFYCAVVGWTFEKVDQGDYKDYNMINPLDNDEIVAGICHKKGEIKKFPSQWLNYVMVETLKTVSKSANPWAEKSLRGPASWENPN